MDFSRSHDDPEIRREFRRFLDERLPDSMRDAKFEWAFDQEFHVEFTTWQREHLAEASDATIDSFSDELFWVNLDPRVGGPTNLVTNTLKAVGTEQQKRDLVPELSSGEALVALGYTEPDSGSDVAAASTRAIRDGEEWVINGQKMFTSNAGNSKYVFLLTRTNIDVPKHKGLTMFIVPIDAPGVEVRPIDTLRRHPTYMTYYTDVRVPDSARVGDVDGGWSVMRVALDTEHGAGEHRSFENRLGNAMGFGPRLSHLLVRATNWAREARRPDGQRVIDDKSARRTLARIAIDGEVSRLLEGRTDPDAAKPGVGNGKKLFTSEAYVRASEELLDIAGPEGLIDFAAPESLADGWIEYSFRDSVVGTIAGGSSEVQRDVIAERRLGLASMRRAAEKPKEQKGG